MAEEPKPEGTGEAGAPPPRQGYISRPPSQADIDRVSEAQGMITDEWAPGEAPTEGDDGPGDRAAAGPGHAGHSTGSDA